MTIIFLCVADSGLTHEEVALRQLASGPNKVGVGKPQSLLSLTANALLQPFNFLMVVVAVVTISPPNSDWKTFTMVMVSSGLAETDLVIEYGSPARSGNTHWHSSAVGLIVITIVSCTALASWFKVWSLISLAAFVST